MIAIIDYGVGNLFSLECSLRALGLHTKITNNQRDLENAQRIILPGVGAFGDAMQKLCDTGLVDTIQTQAQRKPLLGICLGMQLLFTVGYEFGTHKGLGLVPGMVCDMAPDIRAAGFDYKVPQMGWNALRFIKPDNPLLLHNREGDCMYYVHSFYVKNAGESVVAVSEYGVDVPGIVHNGYVFGTQFHPEKSGDAGMRLLRAFAEL